MSSLNKVLFKTCNITPEQEVKYTKGQAGDSNQSQLNAESIVDKITEINYFEDILSPAVTCYLRVSDTTNVISRLPLRGYERVDLAVQTDNGWFEFTSGEGRGGGEKNNPLYVTGIEDVSKNESQEVFEICLSSLQNLMNETVRCQQRFKSAEISTHVETILKEVLMVPEDRISVERSITKYEFIGNTRKPFYLCTWLCPKAAPATTGQVGGTSGFLFYEDVDGYKFRSIDNMIGSTEDVDPKFLIAQDGDPPKIETYTFTTMISRGEASNHQILHYYIDKTTNILKNLRVGLYSNLTYFFNPLNWKTNVIHHKLKDELDRDGMKTAGDDIPIPKGDISSYASRLLVRVGDKGMLGPSLPETANEEEVEDSGRSDADMARAFSRYTLLFQQSLNITVPCNIRLRAGGVIKIVVPESGPSDSSNASGQADNKGVDQQLSGFYLIRSLRHHFELSEGKNVTALNLIRDSFGLN